MTTPRSGKRPPRPSAAPAGPGPAVDAAGAPVIDPTENVKDVLRAAVERIDDIMALRAEHQMFVSTLRAEYQEKLDALEAKRLDAIRQVDQLAVKTEADRSAAAITVLATSAATTAETLRNAVNTSATNLATQLTNTVNAITERIASLEKLSYTGQGKQAVVDPQVAEMLAEIRGLRTAQTADDGKAAGISSSWAILLAVVGLVGTLLGIGGVIVTLVLFLSRSGNTEQPPIYVPAPAGTTLPTTPPTAAPR